MEPPRTFNYGWDIILKIHQDYIEWTQSNIPDPTIVKGTAWDSNYDESDVFLAIADQEKKVLRHEPTIELRLWPTQFIDGSDFHDRILVPSEIEVAGKTKEWADLVQHFLKTIPSP